MSTTSVYRDSMNDDLDPLDLAAWEAFVFAHAAAVGRIERDLARVGTVSLAWYDVLVALANAPDRRLRLNDLADRVVLSRSGLSRLVDRIEKAGLIAREPTPEDRRGLYAVLTPAGERAMRETWPAYANGIARHFAAHLDDDEKRVLATSLRKVRDLAVPCTLELPERRDEPDATTRDR
jgi:DNA-binding MarR family transcriptional regulator